MNTIKVTSLYQAQKELDSRGIKFMRIFTPYIDKEKQKLGIHDYFMLGDCEVAYYTSCLQSLFIHDKPRKWCKEWLDN